MDSFEKHLAAKNERKKRKLFKNKKGIYKSREVVPSTKVEILRKHRKPKYREDFSRDIDYGSD